MLQLLTLPLWFGGALFYLFIFGPWCWRKPRWDSGTITVQWRPRWLSRWRYATNVGYFVGHPAVWSEQERQHERVHMRQQQDNAVNAFWVGAIASIWGGWPAFLLVWGSSVLWPVVDMGTAWVRDAHPNGYRGSERERSAYAQTWRFGNGESWLERHRGASDGRVTP